MFFRWTAKVFYIVLLLVLSCSVHVFTRTLDPGHVLSILGKSNYSISNQQHISISKTSGQFLTIYILQPIGYLVMSEHPALPELVAYSFENEFGAFSEKNPLLTLICAGSEATIRFYNEKHPEPVGAEKALPVKAAAWQWPPQGSTTTGGWLKENWTQDAPYNSLCPMDLVTRTRSLAGCPAIAMGQIINFHKTTNATMFTDADDYVHNYAGRTYRIDDDYATVGFPSFRQLNVYLDSLLRHYVTAAPVSNDEKAALVFGCAVAAKQVFTSEASGTFGVTQALAAYKRFHFCDATLLWPGDSLLLQHIAINVMNKMPVHFASLTQDETAGHNFVVDGFNSENYFHLNMGWGGVYNGWYKLPAQIPYNLTKIEGVIVDINPGYSLQDDNDAPARAQVLTLPVKSYENSIFPAGDVDWYKFALKQGTTITLHAEDFAAFHPSLKFWLYGPCSPDGADIRAGNHIACDDTSFSHTRPRIVFSVKDSGMYFLRVAGASDAPVKVPGDSIGAYVLQIDTVCANPSSVTGARGVAKAGFRVSDCYPNPFNPETRISYTLPSPGVVTVNMYDSRGSLVKNVVTGSVQSAGQHDLQINGQSLASGVYFVRVQYQGAVQSVKIILLK